MQALESDPPEPMGGPSVGDVDLAEAKRRIGDAVCPMGCCDMLYVLKMGTPEDVERQVRYSIETAGPTGFILGTSDSVREGTPRENVGTYFETARRHAYLSARGGRG